MQALEEKLPRRRQKKGRTLHCRDRTQAGDRQRRFQRVKLQCTVLRFFQDRQLRERSLQGRADAIDPKQQREGWNRDRRLPGKCDVPVRIEAQYHRRAALETLDDLENRQAGRIPCLL